MPTDPQDAPDAAPAAAPAAARGASPPDRALARWQNRLLPLMQWTLVGLTLFFFAASTVQLLSLQRRIDQRPVLDLARVLPAAPAGAAADAPQQADLLRLRAAIALEASTLDRRHHHAAVVLMAQLWVRYLGVVTGMILAIVGAVFILGKLQEGFSELTAKAGGAEGSLKSSSPGLVLVVLGSALLLATLLDRRDLSVIDQPVYLGSSSLAPAEAPAVPQLPPRDLNAP